MKVDAIAKKLGNEMNKNNSDIKPSNPLDVVALPQLKEIETPKLDMSKVPGVPKWSHEESTNNDNGKQTGVSWFKSSLLLLIFSVGSKPQKLTTIKEKG